MGDFFAPPPGYPDVPPEPATPPPNFEQMGESLWAGVAKSAGTGGILGNLFDALVRAATFLLGWALKKLISIFAWLITQLTNVETDASANYGTLVSATMQNLFGVSVSPAAVNTRAAGPQRQAAANALAQSLLGALFSTTTPAPGGGVTPSDSAANTFLSTTVNMELNGWIESWLADGLSYHLLEKYGDLKDGLTHVLGLGRMAHTVFSAPIKVLVHDPYLALLNQKYRPKSPDLQTCMRAFFRGDISRPALSTLLGNQGFTEQEINWAIADHTKFVPMNDIDYLLSRSIWTNDQATSQLTAQGYELDIAQQMVALMNDKRTQKYREQMATIARERYVAGDLAEGDYESIVGTLNLPQEEQQWLLNVATFERSTKLTHLSLGQIETNILDGIMSFSDLSAWAQRVNMPLTEEAYLELALLFKQNKESATAKAKAAAASAKATAAQAKATAAAAKATQAKAAAADKGLSATQAETLVEDGLWTFDQLTAYLTNNGYGPDAITAIVTLVHQKISATAAKTTSATATRAAAGAKGLNLAETEKAVVAGILTIDDLEKYLTAGGFDAADSQVIVELTQQALASAQTKAAAKAAATAKAADKQVSLADLERAVRLGLTTMAAYNAALTAAGFDAAAIAILDGLLNSQIAADKAAAATKATKAAAAGSRAASLPQLEQEVIQGIRPIADYTAALLQLGYAPLDQQQLTALLQLKVDQAKATAAKKASAAAALERRGISLTQAETAVKLGVVPIATYQAMLQVNGFTPDAIDVLSSSLLAEVAKASKTQTAANAAAGVLATKNISLPDIERAVIAGISPIGTYTSMLMAAGYSAGDANTLTQLLQLKVDHAAAAAAMHADAVGAATTKGISLASEEAAVVAGDLTMENYDSLLTALGYDAIDRATLEQLLQTKIAAAAAKAGTTSTSSTTAGGSSGAGSAPAGS